MLTKFALAFAAIGLATSAGAVTNILANGSFETGVAPDSVKGFGSTDISGWTVSLPGGVYYSAASWNASEGNRSVELNGTGQGGVYQDVTLVIGKQYRLTFDYSSDPSGTRALVPFILGGRFNQAFVYAVPLGHSANNMQYLQANVLFTATQTANRIAFGSGTINSNGAVIDNAVLSLVPEPATWAMLVAGFGLIGFSVRRRRSGFSPVAN